MSEQKPIAIDDADFKEWIDRTKVILSKEYASGLAHLERGPVGVLFTRGVEGAILAKALPFTEYFQDTTEFAASLREHAKRIGVSAVIVISESYISASAGGEAVGAVTW